MCVRALARVCVYVCVWCVYVCGVCVCTCVRAYMRACVRTYDAVMLLLVRSFSNLFFLCIPGVTKCCFLIYIVVIIFIVFRPDMTFAFDWTLKANYLSIGDFFQN